MTTKKERIEKLEEFFWGNKREAISESEEIKQYSDEEIEKAIKNMIKNGEAVIIKQFYENVDWGSFGEEGMHPDENGIEKIEYQNILDVLGSSIFTVDGKNYFQAVEDYGQGYLLFIEEEFHETIFLSEGEVYETYEEAYEASKKGE
jgi:hypothetical protein